ncbi:MAG: isoprenyl transferase [Chlamydiae bacterium]|nr:MAG: isoprenyl transferase [Chlamydiota bacterium]
MSIDIIKFDKSIPKHIAVIMDGNGRWAKKQGLVARLKGHEAGAETIRAVLRACDKTGVRYLTLYAFSTENWKRSKSEVAGLMELLRRFLIKNTDELIEKGIRLRAIGQIDRLPDQTRKELERSIEKSKNETKLDLILALSYGGRTEIVNCIRRISSIVKSGELNPEDISEETVKQNLYAPDVPDPELLIRTSGEMRISNFLLWQISYSEIYVTEILWPDFRENDFYEAIADYQKRLRRFGGV